MGASILITGAAGYIGSHAIRTFLSENRMVVALDDLSTGNRWAVPESIPFFFGDFADENLLQKIFSEHPIKTVVHFAAKTSVEESVRDPGLYERENFIKTKALAQWCAANGVDHFVFSSTCAVYGSAPKVLVDEKTPARPDSPYGATKLAAEDVLFSIGKISTMKIAALRYFNVAGASADQEIGQANDRVHSLVSICAEAALGERKEVVIHGTDYPTKDGTGVRDYIHVVDLARAHFDVLRYLESGGENLIFNCGYGEPFSVREVVAAMEKVSGKKIQTRDGPRRPGDIPAIYADSSRMRKLTGWEPRLNNLNEICRSAYLWVEFNRGRSGSR